MRAISCIRDGFVNVGFGAALILAAGCYAEPSTPQSEPKAPPASRAIEDLKKDLKPPVVIKPNVPPTTDALPVVPKRELK